MFICDSIWNWSVTCLDYVSLEQKKYCGFFLLQNASLFFFIFNIILTHFENHSYPSLINSPPKIKWKMPLNKCFEFNSKHFCTLFFFLSLFTHHIFLTLYHFCFAQDKQVLCACLPRKLWEIPKVPIFKIKLPIPKKLGEMINHLVSQFVFVLFCLVQFLAIVS